MSFSRRPAPAFNITRRIPKRSPVGSAFRLAQLHTVRGDWWKLHHYSLKPTHVEKHNVMPRTLYDRHMYALPWLETRNLPDETRWEKFFNSMRHSVERVHWVEEDGFQHPVNWKLYSDRVNAELQAAVDALPQYTLCMKAVPMAWKKVDVEVARIRGLSLREAMAQCKFGSTKGSALLLRALEMLQKGAETKGLDKDRLRVGKISLTKGPTDKQIDLKSKGYYAWKTKKATHLWITAVEDPEMRLPDRTRLPYTSQASLRRVGIPTESVVLDVPAITAEGI